MRLNRGLKFLGAACACTMFIMTGSQMVFAGPSYGFANEMVAKIDSSNISIYAEDNETSDIIATALAGKSYDVLNKSGEEWVKVEAGDQEGYLKISDSVTLTEASAEEQAAEQSQESSVRQQVVSYALQFVGGRYKYGGNDPRTGTDCSGFTRYVMQNSAGVSLNRSSSSQAAQGRAISAAEMQPGDLIFYGGKRSINHVAMYIGDGQIVHASTERTGIKTSTWNYRTPVKIISVLD